MNTKIGREISSVDRFWNRYIDKLLENNIKEKVTQWYVRHVEWYIKYHKDKKLAFHTKEDVEAYFNHLNKTNKLEPWQFEQVIEAIKILFCQIIKTSWSGFFHWDHWFASAQTLAKNHSTVARDSPPLRKKARENKPESKNEIKEKHKTLLDQVVIEIRRRNYSYRTEKAYVDWIIRYLWFHSDKNPGELTGQEIKNYLEYLAIERDVSASTQRLALNSIVFFVCPGLES